MAEALRELEGVDEALLEDFWSYLDNFSKLTVNTYPDGSVYYASL
jgi:hemoglobin